MAEVMGEVFDYTPALRPRSRPFICRSLAAEISFDDCRRTAAGSLSIYPRAQTVSMNSLPPDALASFFRNLHMKTSTIFDSGSSMPP